jgi:hypothetical protein
VFVICEILNAFCMICLRGLFLDAVSILYGVWC